MPPVEEARADRTLTDLLDRMRGILVESVEGGASAREQAVHYLDIRSKLLASEIGSLLPGFLYQCRTVMRFSDFIALYDPDLDLRVAFIDRQIARCRNLHKPVAMNGHSGDQDSRKASTS